MITHLMIEIRSLVSRNGVDMFISPGFWVSLGQKICILVTIAAVGGQSTTFHISCWVEGDGKLERMSLPACVKGLPKYMASHAGLFDS